MALGLLRGVGVSFSPAELVSRWESFVEECEGGYSWDISEYDNEIRARGYLDLLLNAESLQTFPELDELASVVKPIDDRFRSLLRADVERPGKQSWYERGVLRRAGSQYSEFFRSAYGIDVESVDA